MGVIVGIDLGTTNSCIAVVRDGRPKVIEDERGYNILPSCIAMKGRGRFVVGHGAKALILTHPTETLYAIKRLIGRKFHSAEVQESIKHVSYDVVEGEHGSVLLRMGDIEITPVEASSIILKAVRGIAEKAVGEPVNDAVITVPANFTHAQRKATMESGEKAGLNVLRLLNEPTAAALAYGFKKDINKKMAVFDLGGGTFDVSILEVGDGVYEILGTAGDTFLGGEDFDYRIVNWLADSFAQQSGVEPRQDKEALQRLKDAAERAKCELSFVDRTPILVPRLHGEHNLEVELTRDQLETMVQDLVNETIKITDQALRTANVSIEELEEIILVGGMTRMPKIQETIRIFFGMNPCKGVHPEEVVAIGAAVHGYSLESETQNTLLLDVTPFALGIETAGGFFKPVIEKNTTVPCSESRTFTTVKDGQAEVKIMVRQGESKLSAENDLLGEFTLTGIREAEKMVPRIDVTFRVDSNGILHVAAVDRDTGESQKIEIRDYIESATGEEPKAITLAQEDIKLPGAVEGAGPDGEGEGASSDPQERAFFGRLAKLAGFGKGGKKKRERRKSPKVDPSQEPHGIASREDSDLAVQPRSEDELAMAARTEDQLAMAARTEDDLATASRPAPDEDIAADLRDALGQGAASASAAQVESEDTLEGPVIDPYGVASRDAEAAAASLRRAEAAAQARRSMPEPEPEPLEFEAGGLIEVDDDLVDPYAVQPRDSADLGGHALDGSAPLDLDDAALDAMDPFGIRERDEPEPEPEPQEAVFAHSTPFVAPAPPPPAARGRKPAKLRIAYKKASTFQREYTRNLKRGGTFIKTKKPLDVGRDCVLHLTVPGVDQPLELRGSVVWSSKGVEVLAGQEEGMGIKYDADDSEGIAALKKALAAL